MLTLATSGAPLDFPTPMTVIVPLALPEQSAMAFTAPREEDVELTLTALDRRGVIGGTGGTMLSSSCAEAEREQATTKSTAARTAKRRRRMAFRFGEDDREVSEGNGKEKKR